VRISVLDCISPLTLDIESEARHDAVETDRAVNRCVAAVTESLKSPSKRFTDFQRQHLCQIFFSMRHAHRAIRELLRSDGTDPMSVNVMPLVRSQLETLFAICLIVENSGSLDLYLKDGWKKLYVRHIMAREECRGLPRVCNDLREQATHLEAFRLTSGVTEAEKHTINEDELGIPLPPGVESERIKQFPSPLGVVRRIQDIDRKKMLKRLYPEYQFLCGFVHFSPASRILSTLLDHRQPISQLSTTGQKYDIFQKEIAAPALWFDLISIVQSCCEFVSVYSADVELVTATAEAWQSIVNKSLVGRVVWELRTRKLLGALA